MLKKLFLSASVLALAGGLALAQAPEAQGPSIAPPPSSSSMTRLLASYIYKANVYDNAENKIGDVTDLVSNSNGNITTAVIVLVASLVSARRTSLSPSRI